MADWARIYLLGRCNTVTRCQPLTVLAYTYAPPFHGGVQGVDRLGPPFLRIEQLETPSPTTMVVSEMATEVPKKDLAIVSEGVSSAICFQLEPVSSNTYAVPRCPSLSAAPTLPRCARR